jgi:DNA polymerase-3 subunit alpha
MIGFIGMVSSLKSITDRSGRPMAFVTLEDFNGSVEGVTFADLFEKNRAAIQPGAVLETKARVSVRDEEEPKLVFQSLRALAPPDAATQEPSGALTLDLTRTKEGVSLEQLRELLHRHPGRSPVYFLARTAEDPATTQIRARGLLVRISDELIAELKSRLGEEAVSLAGAVTAVPF